MHLQWIVRLSKKVEYLKLPSFAHVKLFLSFSLTLFQVETYAEVKCKEIVSPARVSSSSIKVKTGSQILQEKDPRLHLSKAVERVVSKSTAASNKSTLKPSDKLDLWLASMSRLAQKAESSDRTLNQVKTILQKQFVIKFEEIPQSYFDQQVRLARERGHGDITLVSAEKKKLGDNLIQDQNRSLDSWTEYLISKDTEMYPMWLKYWMFSGMTKLSKYDVKTGKFGNRDKGTVAPFAELNREALGLLADYVLKYLNKKALEDLHDPALADALSGLNFGKIYGRILSNLSISNVGGFKTNSGKWIIYKQGSDHTPLVKSLEGRNTGWCTAGESTARSQLKNGDFHVFYSLDDQGLPTIPRVAIRMEGDDIAEVRGVAADQNLDSQINQSSVVSSKMKEFGSKAELFEKRDLDMKLLTRIEVKQNLNDQLSKEDLSFLWELHRKIEGFGYKKDPRIERIRSQRNLKSDIVEIFDQKYTTDEVTTTIAEFLSSNGRSKIHVGELYLPEVKFAEEANLPEIVFGELNMGKLISAEGLKLPKKLFGNLYLNGLKSSKGLLLPKEIQGTLSLNGLSSADGLRLPKTIHGSLFLEGLTSAQGLLFPDVIYGALSLERLQSAIGLVLPKVIHGYLDLRELTSAVGLKLPETIHQGIYLNKLTNAQGLEFPTTIGVKVVLTRLTSGEGLKLPETIRGNLFLEGLKSAQGSELPRAIYGNLHLDSLGSAEGLRLPDTVQGALYLDSLASAKGLKMPTGVDTYRGPKDIGE